MLSPTTRSPWAPWPRLVRGFGVGERLAGRPPHKGSSGTGAVAEVVVHADKRAQLPLFALRVAWPVVPSDGGLLHGAVVVHGDSPALRRAVLRLRAQQQQQRGGDASTAARAKAQRLAQKGLDKDLKRLPGQQARRDALVTELLRDGRVSVALVGLEVQRKLRGFAQGSGYSINVSDERDLLQTLAAPGQLDGDEHAGHAGAGAGAAAEVAGQEVPPPGVSRLGGLRFGIATADLRPVNAAALRVAGGAGLADVADEGQEEGGQEEDLGGLDGWLLSPSDYALAFSLPVPGGLEPSLYVDHFPEGAVRAVPERDFLRRTWDVVALVRALPDTGVGSNDQQEPVAMRVAVCGTATSLQCRAARQGQMAAARAAAKAAAAEEAGTSEAEQLDATGRTGAPCRDVGRCRFAVHFDRNDRHLRRKAACAGFVGVTACVLIAIGAVLFAMSDSGNGSGDDASSDATLLLVNGAGALMLCVALQLLWRPRGSLFRWLQIRLGFGPFSICPHGFRLPMNGGSAARWRDVLSITAPHGLAGPVVSKHGLAAAPLFDYHGAPIKGTRVVRFQEPTGRVDQPCAREVLPFLWQTGRRPEHVSILSVPSRRTDPGPRLHTTGRSTLASGHEVATYLDQHGVEDPSLAAEVASILAARIHFRAHLDAAGYAQFPSVRRLVDDRGLRARVRGWMLTVLLASHPALVLSPSRLAFLMDRLAATPDGPGRSLASGLGATPGTSRADAHRAGSADGSSSSSSSDSDSQEQAVKQKRSGRGLGDGRRGDAGWQDVDGGSEGEDVDPDFYAYDPDGGGGGDGGDGGYESGGSGGSGGGASCPLVFSRVPLAAAGGCASPPPSKWRYETDVGGVSLVGGVYDLSGRPGGDVRSARGTKTASFTPLDVPLPADVSVSDGTVSVMLLEGQDEVSYVDQVELRELSVPRGALLVSGTALLRGWCPHLAEGSDGGTSLLAFDRSSLIAPQDARWQNREDCAAFLASPTDVAAPAARDEDNFYQMRFVLSDESGEPHPLRCSGTSPWLVVHGWKFKTERSGLASRQSRPRLKLRDLQTGRWTKVRALSWPRGDRKYVAFDLSGLSWGSSAARTQMNDLPCLDLRLYTGTSRDGLALWYLDSVHLTLRPPTVVGSSSAAVRPLARAEFTHVGMPTPTPPTATLPGAVPPLLCEPDGCGPSVPPFTCDGESSHAIPHVGDDVSRQLLSAGRLVVLQPGDAIDLRFEVDAREPDSMGEDAATERRFLLTVRCAYKPRIVPGMETPLPWTRTVGPLPIPGQVYSGETIGGVASRTQTQLVVA